MAENDTEIAVIGGGAAGIAAARHLTGAGIACLLIEARPRLGGRAWTVRGPDGVALDLGCGWLHSADRNPWCAIAEAAGATVDRSPPPWGKLAFNPGFSPREQRDFLAARNALQERMEGLADTVPDVPAAAFLQAGNRWNGLVDAVSTYFSGVALDRLSTRDFNSYDDTGINWRVAEGYGTVIAGHGAGLPVLPDCPVEAIDHGGRRLRIATAKGTITADAAIVTLPSSLIAEEALRFTPILPDKTAAARGLPLGLADKLFLSLEGAEEFETDSRLFGRTDRRDTGAYHLRPLGKPLIEGYFGGDLANALEAGGEGAFVDFAVAELAGVLGSGIAARLKPIGYHGWRTDPFARGSYSYALPGKADCRAALAAPVDDRLFFAGEATSPNDYSTAHGAYLTGIAAAEAAIAARGRKS